MTEIVKTKVKYPFSWLQHLLPAKFAPMVRLLETLSNLAIN
jgi:hypothetical protein